MDNMSSFTELLARLKTDSDFASQFDQSPAVQMLLDLLKKVVASNSVEAKDLNDIKSSIRVLVRDYGVYTPKFHTALNSFVKEVKDAMVTGARVTREELAVAIARELSGLIKVSESQISKGKEPVLNLSDTDKSKQFKGTFGKPVTKTDLDDVISNALTKLFSFLGIKEQEKDSKDKKKQGTFIAELLNGLANSKFVGGAIRDGVRLAGLVMGAQVKQFFKDRGHEKLGSVLGSAVYILSSVVSAMPSLLKAIGGLITALLVNTAARDLMNFFGKGGTPKTIGGKPSFLSRFSSMFSRGETPTGVAQIDRINQAPRMSSGPNNVVQFPTGGVTTNSAQTGVGTNKNNVIKGPWSSKAEAPKPAGWLSKVMSSPITKTLGWLGVGYEGLQAAGSVSKGNYGASALHTLSTLAAAGAMYTTPAAGTGAGAAIPIGLGLASWGLGNWANKLDNEDREKKSSPDTYFDSSSANKNLKNIRNTLQGIASDVKKIANEEGRKKWNISSWFGGGSSSGDSKPSNRGFRSFFGSNTSGYTKSPHNLTGSLTSHNSPYFNTLDIVSSGTPNAILQQEVQKVFGVSALNEGDHLHFAQDVSGLKQIQGLGIKKGAISKKTLAKAKSTGAMLDPDTGVVLNAGLMERSNLLKFMEWYANTPQGSQLYEKLDDDLVQQGSMMNDIPYAMKGTSDKIRALNENLASKGYSKALISGAAASQGQLSSTPASIKVDQPKPRETEKPSIDTPEKKEENKMFNMKDILNAMRGQNNVAPSVTPPNVFNPTGNQQLSQPESILLNYSFHGG